MNALQSRQQALLLQGVTHEKINKENDVNLPQGAADEREIKRMIWACVGIGTAFVMLTPPHYDWHPPPFAPAVCCMIAPPPQTPALNPKCFFW